MPSHGYYIEGYNDCPLQSPKSGKLEVVLSIIRRIALPASGGSVTASALFRSNCNFLYQTVRFDAFSRLPSRGKKPSSPTFHEPRGYERIGFD